jgi:hypothetical protein
LSGPISGLDFQTCTDWREYASRAFPSFIEGVSPLRAQRHLEHVIRMDSKEAAYTANPTTTGRAILSRDKFDTLEADLVLCNLLGAKTVSIGTVMELAWAHLKGIPIIVSIEPGFHVHTHGMLDEVYDVIYHSLDEAIEGVVHYLAPQEKYMSTNILQLRMAREANKLDLQLPEPKVHA